MGATLTPRSMGNHDTFAGSVDKLLVTWVDQRLHTAALDAGGTGCPVRTGSGPRALLWARAASIFGGTSQVQRTIVTQRILGLPRHADE